MPDSDQADQIRDDDQFRENDVEDASSACTALVKVVPTAAWSRARPLFRPNSIFVTHLIATVEQVPQTRSLRRASAADASAAYTATRHPAVGTGLRERQII